MKYTRQHEIEKYILSRDFVSLDELCEAFGASKNTIRRDVAQLLHNGTMEKVYGGVRAVRTPSEAMVNYQARSEMEDLEKQRIGALAARFVGDNDVIFIDSGTTTIHLLPHIAQLTNVTVLTNNLQALIRCAEYPQLNTICFGGQLNTETASFSSNFCALENLRSFNVSKAFMAATGVSIERGATNSSPGELAIKKTIVENSDERFLLVDSAKFDHAALLTYSALCNFQKVVTERAPRKEYLAYFTQQGIQLVTE